jgi:hypothetical protein
VAEINLPFSLADHFTKLLPKLCKWLLRLKNWYYKVYSVPCLHQYRFFLTM